MATVTSFTHQTTKKKYGCHGQFLLLTSRLKTFLSKIATQIRPNMTENINGFETLGQMNQNLSKAAGDALNNLSCRHNS